MKAIQIVLLVVAVMVIYPLLLVAYPFSFQARKEVWAVNSAVALYMWSLKTTYIIKYKNTHNKW